MPKAPEIEPDWELVRKRNFVGILVQRVGRHGKLHRVGRVPLGHHGRSRLRLHWNLRVNGKRLHAGRYRITLRAIDRKARFFRRSSSGALLVPSPCASTIRWKDWMAGADLRSCKYETPEKN